MIFVYSRVTYLTYVPLQIFKVKAKDWYTPKNGPKCKIGRNGRKVFKARREKKVSKTRRKIGRNSRKIFKARREKKFQKLDVKSVETLKRYLRLGEKKSFKN